MMLVLVYIKGVLRRMLKEADLARLYYFIHDGMGSFW